MTDWIYRITPDFLVSGVISLSFVAVYTAILAIEKFFRRKR